MADDPLETLAKRVKILAKTMLQQSADELAVAYNENFSTDLKGKRTKDINATNRLRVYKGNLARAVSGKDEAGAIFEVTVKGSEVVLESGVDDSVIPYARIHEFGGKAGRNGAVTLRPRPYLRPGMEQYLKESLPRNIKRLMKMLGAT